MKKTVIVFAALNVIAFSSNDCFAQIVDYGSYFTDTNTGIDWLKTPATVGQSFDAISNRLSPGQELFGWSYATSDQLNTVIENILSPQAANKSNELAFNPQPFSYYDSVLSIFTPTYDTLAFPGNQIYPYNQQGRKSLKLITEAGGVLENVGTSVQSNWDFLTQNSTGNYSIYAQFSNWGALFNNQSNLPETASALIRQSVTTVPLPAPIFIFSSALAGLGIFNRLLRRNF